MEPSSRSTSTSAQRKSMLSSAGLLLLLGGLLIYQGIETSGNSSAIESQDLALSRLKHSVHIEAKFNDLTRWMLDYAITQLDESEQEADKAFAALSANLGQLGADLPRIKQAGFESHLGDARALIKKATTAYLGNDPITGHQFMAQARESLETCRRTVANEVAAQQDLVRQAGAELQSSGRRIFIVFVAGLIMTVAAGLYLVMIEKGRGRLERKVRDHAEELGRTNDTLRKEMSEREKAEESLHKREEQYRHLVESSPDAILILGDEGFVYSNRAAQRLFAAGPPGSLEGGDLGARIDPQHLAAVREYLAKAADPGGDAQILETKAVRLDGKPVDVELVAIPFTFDGKPVRQLIFRDITKRKEVDRLKSEFVSTVSHELRTPLTSIKGSLGLISSGALGMMPAPVKPLLEVAGRNCDRLVRLINDLLDIEKMSAGKMDFRLKPMDVMPVIEQALEANRSYAAQSGVTLILKNRVSGAKVAADHDRIMQVMANLLSNAAKFSPAGSEVEVNVTKDAGVVRVSVADHGPGIPDEFRSRIFQKFAQADSSDTRQKGGTGLGLSITKAIVEHHAGNIDFESAAGAGTTFTFTLPEYREPTVTHKAVAPDAPKILICEDDRDVALLLAIMLREEGFRTECAYDAAQAEKMIAEGGYQAMTLDIMLPDKSGIEVIRDLKRKGGATDVPIVVVSAKAEMARRALEGSAVEVADWLNKPIDKDRLISSVKAAVTSSAEKRPVLLHVEDDTDIQSVVSLMVRDFADVVSVPTLEEAKTVVRQRNVDLVILDLALPDGSGLDLLPELGSGGRRPVPVLVFSSHEVGPKAARSVDAALVKSRVSQGELLRTIRALVRKKSVPEASRVG